MSDIPVELANIFHAGREEFARTDDYHILRERLEKFFENEVFEKWDKEYQDKEKYIGDEHPKKFEYVGEQPKEVDKSSYSLVSFRTEAEDKLLTRKKDRYYIDWSKDSRLFDVVVRGMNKGVISLRVDCRENVKAGDEDKITFTLLDPEKKK